MKKLVSIIELSQEQVNNLTVNEIKTDVLPRVTGRKAHQYLVELLKSGKVTVNTPAALFALTYGNVTVAGFTPEKGQDVGKKTPERILPQEEFDNLSPENVSAICASYTTEHRAYAVVSELVIDGGLKLSPRDVAFLTNGGIVVEGIEIEKISSTRPAHTIITKGIVVN